LIYVLPEAAALPPLPAVALAFPLPAPEAVAVPPDVETGVEDPAGATLLEFV